MKERKKNEVEWNEQWTGNKIGTGAKAISESLKINTSLTTLYLDSDEKKRNERIENTINEKWNNE